MDWEDVWDIVKILVIGILVLVLMFGVLGILPDYIISKSACSRYAALNSTHEFKFDYIMGGCYVNWNGVWVHASKIDMWNGTIQIETAP
jgi:hypothetical protein